MGPVPVNLFTRCICKLHNYIEFIFRTFKKNEWIEIMKLTREMVLDMNLTPERCVPPESVQHSNILCLHQPIIVNMQ